MAEPNYAFQKRQKEIAKKKKKEEKRLLKSGAADSQSPDVEPTLGSPEKTSIIDGT